MSLPVEVDLWHIFYESNGCLAVAAETNCAPISVNFFWIAQFDAENNEYACEFNAKEGHDIPVNLFLFTKVVHEDLSKLHT